MSGADLSNVVNQAALKASVDGLPKINMTTFEWAKDKILMGSERRSAVISKETARMTAYHEVMVHAAPTHSPSRRDRRNDNLCS
jgi:ATP-dependent metalloprotease